LAIKGRDPNCEEDDPHHQAKSDVHNDIEVASAMDLCNSRPDSYEVFHFMDSPLYKIIKGVYISILRRIAIRATPGLPGRRVVQRSVVFPA